MAKQIIARFAKLQTNKLQPLLDMLTALVVLRQIEEGYMGAMLVFMPEFP